MNNYFTAKLYCLHIHFVCMACNILKVKVKVAQSCLTLCDPIDCWWAGIARTSWRLSVR